MFDSVKNYLSEQAKKGVDLQSTKVEANQVLLAKHELGSKINEQEKEDLMLLLRK